MSPHSSPSYQRLRPDRNPEDVGREVAEGPPIPQTPSLVQALGGGPLAHPPEHITPNAESAGRRRLSSARTPRCDSAIASLPRRSLRSSSAALRWNQYLTVSFPTKSRFWDLSYPVSDCRSPSHSEGPSFPLLAIRCPARSSQVIRYCSHWIRGSVFHSYRYYRGSWNRRSRGLHPYRRCQNHSIPSRYPLAQKAAIQRRMGHAMLPLRSRAAQAQADVQLLESLSCLQE